MNVKIEFLKSIFFVSIYHEKVTDFDCLYLLFSLIGLCFMIFKWGFRFEPKK